MDSKLFALVLGRQCLACYALSKRFKRSGASQGNEYQRLRTPPRLPEHFGVVESDEFYISMSIKEKSIEKNSIYVAITAYDLDQTHGCPHTKTEFEVTMLPKGKHKGRLLT